MSKINRGNFFDDILTYKEYEKRIKFLSRQSEFDLYCIIRNKLAKKYSGYHKINKKKNERFF